MASFKTADGRLHPPLPAPPPRSSSAKVDRATFRTRLLGSFTPTNVLQWGFRKGLMFNTETASPSGRRFPEGRKRRIDYSSSSEGDDEEEEEDGSDENNGGRVRAESTSSRYQIAVGSSIQEVSALPPVVKMAQKAEPAPTAAPSSDESQEVRDGPSPSLRSTRPWNLRKRRSVCGLPTAQRQQHPHSPLQAAPNNHLAAPRARKDSGTEKKEKTTLLLTLTKEEIYEDFKLMTDAPPPRKHKKRPVKVQRYIQAMYPEPSALTITADLYKVPEEKGQRR